jgi:hypothetical protein
MLCEEHNCAIRELVLDDDLSEFNKPGIFVQQSFAFFLTPARLDDTNLMGVVFSPRSLKMYCTDKGKLIVRWGRKAVSLVPQLN